MKNYCVRHWRKMMAILTVRSHTSYSSTIENQIYLCVPTEQRRLVVKRTKKILQYPYTV